MSETLPEQKPLMRKTKSLAQQESRVSVEANILFLIIIVILLTTTANSWHKLQDSLDKAQMVSASAPPTEGVDLRLSYVSGTIATREVVKEPFANTPLPYAAAVLVDTIHKGCLRSGRRRSILTEEAAEVVTPVTLTIAGHPVWYSFVNNNLDKLVLPVDMNTLPQIVAGHPERMLKHSTLYETTDGSPFERDGKYCNYIMHRLYYIPKDINVTLIGWLATDEKEGLVLTSSPLLAKGYNGVAPYEITPAEIVKKAGDEAKPTIMLCAILFYFVAFLHIHPLDRLAMPHNPLSLWRVNLLGIASTIMTVGYFDRISSAFLALFALLGSILVLYIILRVTQRAKKLPSA